LIVCEGTQTEPGYFQETRHLERSLIDLEMSPGGEPKALVERAVEKKKSDTFRGPATWNAAS
jgi:hypothetical protein